MENFTSQCQFSTPTKGNLTANCNGSYDYYASGVHASITGWFVFTATVSICGTVLLVCLLVAALSQRKLRDGSGFLIVHLTCQHLFLCAISFPVLTVDSYKALIPGSAGLALHCPSFMFVHKSTVHAESWASVLLAVNRLIAVTRPLLYRRATSRTALIGMVCASWLLGFVLNIPLFFGIGLTFTTYEPFKYCSTQSTGGPYSTVYTWMERYLPLGLTGVFYAALFVHLRLKLTVVAPSSPQRSLFTVRTKPPPDSSSHDHHNIHHPRAVRQLLLAKITAAAFLWHCLCFLPGPISQNVAPDLYASSRMPQFWLLRTAALCGYAANPVFFFALSSDYQTALSHLLCKLRPAADSPPAIAGTPKRSDRIEIL
ncbi:hypothetical protein BV898_15273 [Hypsibius exemplaris]|uniref:G-protein coupled receptors family 1 profile domain-containing protein n=1 Tax=Hypsibius exemplaris TaxID=2072580 RepID=A0A9X6RKC4_HYPEX|nr:hypothetical protein BV898_15273 [Hypsibius exemplaris]